jgi:hypothetical protein
MKKLYQVWHINAAGKKVLCVSRERKRQAKKYIKHSLKYYDRYPCYEIKKVYVKEG